MRAGSGRSHSRYWVARRGCGAGTIGLGSYRYAMPPEPIHGSAHPIGGVLERTGRRLRLRDLLRATAFAVLAAGATHGALTMLRVAGAWRIGIATLVLVASAWLVLNRTRRH